MSPVNPHFVYFSPPEAYPVYYNWQKRVFLFFCLDAAPGPANGAASGTSNSPPAAGSNPGWVFAEHAAHKPPRVLARFDAAAVEGCTEVVWGFAFCRKSGFCFLGISRRGVHVFWGKEDFR